jgi:hypothetical protein
MKVKQVSAFRVKRGLRRDSGAEPPVVGHPPQTTDERKTDTMKTYILRRAKTVEDFWPGTEALFCPPPFRLRQWLRRDKSAFAKVTEDRSTFVTKSYGGTSRRAAGKREKFF